MRANLTALFCSLLIATVAQAAPPKTKPATPATPSPQATAVQVQLLTPQQAAQRATQPNTRVLDVRPDVHTYFQAHVPNAVYLADSALRGPANGMPVQYWPLDTEAMLLQRAGISDTTEVIVYSDGENVLGATMALYVLQRLGHRNVALMNGGWSGYQSTQQQTTQVYPSYQTTTLSVREVTDIRATLADVRTGLDTRHVTFVDARPAAAYRGETKTWQRNGHIPGAINIDWHTLVDQSNASLLKPTDQIRTIFESQGITPDKDIIVYCGTSREASLELVALHNMLKYPHVRLYEGSWTEYSSTNLPLETGAGRTASAPSMGTGGAGTAGQTGTGGTGHKATPDAGMKH